MVDRLSVSAVTFISSFFRSLGWRACRFHPTCSSYAQEAFGRFTWLKAARLSLMRVLRCNPFCAGGHDPLPEERS